MKKVIFLIFLVSLVSSCTKKYKCNRFQGAFDVYYNPKEQSCYYSANGKRTELKKEQCASLCYEDN
jgi:hypothetical protein